VKQIGRRARPLDWDAITSGRFRYAGDLALDGLLVGRILRSPHARARIVAIDVGRARGMPGVHAVVTADDFPPDARYIHDGAADRAPIARNEARFVGEEVAAVAAETYAQAEAALRAIRVVYQPLPAPFTIEEALAAGAPELHERPTGVANLALRLFRRWGDVDAARAVAPVKIRGSYWFPHHTHLCMETNTTVAWWEDDRKLHLWTGTQAPFFIIKELAQLLKLQTDQIVCHEIGIGGGFGAKSRICDHEAITVVLARKARRPVRIALSRAEEFATTKTRHAWRMNLCLHADGEGRVRAVDGLIKADNGAYVHSGPTVLTSGPKALGTLYRAEAIEVEALLVDTSKQPGGQFRGYGTTQAVYALESLMDELAERLNVDPIDIRIRNANQPFTTTIQGARIQTARLVECLETVRDALDWDRKKANRVPGRGVGVAAAFHSSGTYAFPGSNRNDSAIDIFTDGRVLVRFGGADTGTGQKTILAQIVAEELGVELDHVQVLSIESDKTPYDLGAWGTRGTYYSGHAARKAAAEAAERLRWIAARPLGNQPITLEDGCARAGDAAVPIGELVRMHPDTVDGVLTTVSSFVDTTSELVDPQTGRGNLSSTYSFAAHAAEVEVDLRTGRLRVLDYVAAHDIGTAINPTMVEGQLAGGVAMGLGPALGEELIHEQGRLANPAYIHYAAARAADLPRIRTVLIEGGDPQGPYGAKGVGELCNTPPPPAIANALYDAIGVRITDLPMTPDKILTALARKKGRTRHHALWRRPGRWWIALVRWAYPRGLFGLLRRWHGDVARRSEPCEIESLATPSDLASATKMCDAGALPVAGGTDLLPGRQQGLLAPKRLVSVMDVAEMTSIEIGRDGSISIGAAVALATLAETLSERCPIIAEAIAHIASPQIRAMATVGGNLLQDQRCWFYRNDFACYKRNGPSAPCYAILGDHRFYHAAIGGHRCQAVTPSDLATVLVALDAEAVLTSAAGTRIVAIGDLYRGPGETVLRTGELLSHVRIGAAAAARRGAFEKLGLWEGDFAVASVALTSQLDQDGSWRDTRMVLGGMAPIPWRARTTERRLDGTAPTTAALRRHLDDELNRSAHPLPGNAWKLDAVAGLAETACDRLLGRRPAMIYAGTTPSGASAENWSRR